MKAGMLCSVDFLCDCQHQTCKEKLKESFFEGSVLSHDKVHRIIALYRSSSATPIPLNKWHFYLHVLTGYPKKFTISTLPPYEMILAIMLRDSNDPGLQVHFFNDAIKFLSSSAEETDLDLSTFCAHFHCKINGCSHFECCSGKPCTHTIERGKFPVETLSLKMRAVLLKTMAFLFYSRDSSMYKQKFPEEITQFRWVLSGIAAKFLSVPELVETAVKCAAWLGCGQDICTSITCKVFLQDTTPDKLSHISAWIKPNELIHLWLDALRRNSPSSDLIATTLSSSIQLHNDPIEVIPLIIGVIKESTKYPVLLARLVKRMSDPYDIAGQAYADMSSTPARLRRHDPPVLTNHLKRKYPYPYTDLLGPLQELAKDFHSNKQWHVGVFWYCLVQDSSLGRFIAENKDQNIYRRQYVEARKYIVSSGRTTKITSLDELWTYNGSEWDVDLENWIGELSIAGTVVGLLKTLSAVGVLMLQHSSEIDGVIEILMQVWNKVMNEALSHHSDPYQAEAHLNELIRALTAMTYASFSLHLKPVVTSFPVCIYSIQACLECGWVSAETFCSSCSSPKVKFIIYKCDEVLKVVPSNCKKPTISVEQRPLGIKASQPNLSMNWAMNRCISRLCSLGVQQCFKYLECPALHQNLWAYSGLCALVKDQQIDPQLWRELFFNVDWSFGIKSLLFGQGLHLIPADVLAELKVRGLDPGSSRHFALAIIKRISEAEQRFVTDYDSLASVLKTFLAVYQDHWEVQLALSSLAAFCKAHSVTVQALLEVASAFELLEWARSSMASPAYFQGVLGMCSSPEVLKKLFMKVFSSACINSSDPAKVHELLTFISTSCKFTSHLPLDHIFAGMVVTGNSQALQALGDIFTIVQPSTPVNLVELIGKKNLVTVEKTTVFHLLCNIGLEEQVRQRIDAYHLFSTSPPDYDIELDRGNYKQMLRDATQLLSDTSVRLSQSTYTQDAHTGWRACLIKNAKDIQNTIVRQSLPLSVKVSASVGLIRVLFQLYKDNEFPAYMFHRLISILQLLQFASKQACALCLRAVVTNLSWDQLKESFGGLLCLAVDLRNVVVSQGFPAIDVVEYLFSFYADPSFKEVLDYHIFVLLALEDFLPTNVKCFLEDNPQVFLAFIQSKWENLAIGITAPSPQVQATALGILKISAHDLDSESRDLILTSLSVASSQQNSRKELNETLYDIGLLIAECYGKVGASISSREFKMTTSSLETNCLSVEESLLLMVEAYMERHTNSELCFFARNSLRKRLGIPIEANTTGWDLGDLAEFDKRVTGQIGIKRLAEELSCNVEPEAPEYLTCLPLLSYSLEFTGKVMGLIIGDILKRGDEDQLRKWKPKLKEVLMTAGMSSQRMLLQVFERVRTSQLLGKRMYTIAHLNLVDFDSLFSVLIKLDLPKALFIIEKMIRERFAAERRRVNFAELTDLESDRLTKVFIELKAANYIREIPMSCVEAVKRQEYQTAQRQEFLNLLETLAQNCNYFNLAKAAERQTGLFTLADDTSSRCFDLLVGSLWRQQSWDSLGALMEKYLKVYLGREMIGVETYIGMLFIDFSRERASLNSLNIFQNSLQSYFRSRAALFPQVYEYVFINHLVENFRLLLQGASINEIMLRDTLLDQRFVWRELAFRAELVFIELTFPQLETSKLAHGLVKSSIANFNLKYATNYLMSLDLLQPIFKYYWLKMSVIQGEEKRKVLNDIDLKLLRQDESNYRPELNAEVPFYILKYKAKLLYVRVYCDNAWKLTEQDLDCLEALLVLDLDPRASWLIEKAYVAIAENLDKHSDESNEDAKLTAEYYAKALRYGHSCYHISMTRCLMLYFNLVKVRDQVHDIEALHQVYFELAECLPLHVLASTLDLFLAHCTSSDLSCQRMIKHVVSRLLVKHPSQMAWIVHDLCKRKAKFLQAVLADCNTTALSMCKNIIMELKKAAESQRLKELKISCDFELAKLSMPVRSNFEILKVDPHLNLWGQETLAYTANPVYISSVEKNISVMSSKAKPKKIALKGSDGCTRAFLLKSEKSADLRKESRIASLIEIVNNLFANSPEVSSLGLSLPSYCIMSISPEVCIIEWVPDTATLRSIITEYWDRHKVPVRWNYIERIYPNKSKTGAKHSIPENWVALMNAVRPVFYQYFEKHNEDPADWLQRRINYTRSLAAWSMFGYIIGLGDRHCDNILIDVNTSKLVFIDLECIFDFGMTLRVPEIVPFRFTPEIVDALGIYEEQGEFEQTCEKVLEVMKQNKRIILAQVERFVHDPLVVKFLVPETRQEDSDLKSTIKTVTSKLEGIHKESNKVMTTQVQVKELIKAAKDSEKLREMYEGWAPWM
mmetsp:Transcript_32781/g.57031  ORF Transcript_32781/g.57031 Transcript_32781/m.57031 type:complete len:2324 (-) Transcript_32781:513-7484(-)|eukprot:CAMPEP_0204906904 /NCGR_PEP_ID=MMETSP1397-20131031/6215_1 /ASSEMBLY_ACC=CAM_ASM_000891 /TAXON_ID=49980 /ORGANISM="Climacostomum Climacostomum virens, Strain Stock W-24" /LENGTH=2323 /DNA_ID=CAMNT_0052075909 /DNA_START=1330 /DNA_END=8301 /DNA_ORIENTATION=-